MLFEDNFSSFSRTLRDMAKGKGKKKNNKSLAAKSRLGLELIPGPGRPSNPSQVTSKMWCNMQNFQFPVASGAIAAVATIAPNDILFVSSLQNVWDEFRVLECDVNLYATAATQGASTTAGGLMKFYWDENDSSVPTGTTAGSKRGYFVNLSAQSPHSHIKMHWAAEDLNDLDYVPMTSSSTASVYLKAYCDTSNYGTSASDSVSRIIGVCQVLIEFRGLGGG